MERNQAAVEKRGAMEVYGGFGQFDGVGKGPP